MAKEKFDNSNITNYAEEFKTLSNIEAFRHTPAQFLGYTGNRGFINMVREIFQNAADEVIKESSPANEIWVTYSEKSPEIMIKDNGRGIPFDKIIPAFTSSHTSSNYEKKPGQFSSGRHGVGAKAVSACSEFFIVDSFILGKHRRVTFKYGDPETAKIEDLKDEPGTQGTMITFKPIDKMPPDMEKGQTVMGPITTTYEEILDLIRQLLPLLTVGTKVNFIGIDKNGKTYSEVLVNHNGLMDGLELMTSSPVTEPIHFGKLKEDGMMQVELAFTYDASSSNEEIISYGNYCPTVDGTHIKGFKEGLVKYFKNYMNKFYLSNKSKLTMINNDMFSGLRAFVTVAHLEPEFTGQAKEIISNTDITPFVRDVTYEYLIEWAKNNPTALQKVCAYLKDVAEIRTKGEKERVKIVVKNASAISGLPSKYIKPTGKKNTELFIVEGDSAKGSISNKRANDRQGVFPIRGKLVNTFSKKREEVLKNAEISGIISIIGCGYGKAFDINKCNWEKVIIATDADPDGAHIRVLLLKFFLTFMEPLIAAGRLYATVPPLFGGKINNKQRYFTDRNDFNEYIQSLFVKNYTLETESGVKYSKQDFVNLLNINDGYIETLESISNGYAIDPNLLEDICINLDKDFKKFKSIIEKKYRFIEVNQEKKSINISGIVDDKYQSILFNDDLLQRFNEIISYTSKSPTNFIVNGKEKYSLYGILKLAKTLAPKNITRYKGLGEMTPQQLFDSTVNPDGDRTLIRYTVEDIKAEINRLKDLENDYSQLLKDIDISKFVF